MAHTKGVNAPPTPPAGRIVLDRRQPPGPEPFAPQVHGRPRRAAPPRDLARRDPLGSQEHNPRPEVHPPRGGAGVDPLLDAGSVGVADRQCRRSPRHGRLPPVQRHATRLGPNVNLFM